MATGRIPTTANSPLTAKGDLFGYSTTQARVAVGNDGETLVADSSTSTGLNYKPLDAAGKNYLINGGFDIWQRGTSFTPSSTAYCADRWTYNNNSAMTISRQTSGLTGFTYALRMQRNSGSTSTTQVIVAQSMESSQALSLAGKTATISFYVRCGATYASGTAYGYVYTGTGTDQNLLVGYTGATSPFAATFTPTTTWTRVTATGTISSSATEVALQINFNPTGTAGATDFLEIAGVQLELGSTATTFSRAGGTIQGELAACQRYYWRNTPGTAYGSHSGTAIVNTSTSLNIVFNNPTSMRVAPTAIEYGNLAVFDTSTVIALSTLSLISSQSSIGTIFVSATGTAFGSFGKVMYVLNNNNTAGYFGASAEL
jgi:hypothetical protein